MNKRIYEIKVRMTADEMAHLNQLVAASGLPCDTFLAEKVRRKAQEI